MKTKMNLLKTAVMAIALMGTTSLFAQVYQYPVTTTPISAPTDLGVGTVTNNTGSVTTMNDAVLFYYPDGAGGSQTGITLQASLDDGTNTFDSYEWHKVSTDGTTETSLPISGETTQTLIRPNLSSGYHKFRVYGKTAAGCLSTEYQDIIVFVLPQLEVLPTISGTLTYCEGEPLAVTLDATNITADYSANINGYNNPPASDFALTYHWYAVPASGLPTPTIDLGTVTTPTVDFSTSTPAITLGSDSYTFYVEVEYASTIRDVSEASGDVTYEGNVDATTGTVTVSPIPETPTITIGPVTD